MSIDFIQLLPCKKCGKTFERWGPKKELCDWDYPTSVVSLLGYIRNAMTEWHSFPDFNFFTDSVKEIIGNANENEWIVRGEAAGQKK